MNQLYYGDNLDVLRRYIKDESVDLVYLDPPSRAIRITTSSSPKETEPPPPNSNPSKALWNGME